MTTPKNALIALVLLFVAGMPIAYESDYAIAQADVPTDVRGG